MYYKMGHLQFFCTIFEISEIEKMAPNWSRLIRFIAEEDGQVHLGEVDGGRDIGLALLNKETVTAKLVTGSVFDGTVTEKQLHVAQVRFQNIPWPGVF